MTRGLLLDIGGDLGFGHAHDGPNFTNSPSNSASSCVHSARIASMYSRNIVRRRPGGTLWSASSSVFQPNPTPRLTRPLDRWSRVAIDLASVMGSCSTGSATAGGRVGSLALDRDMGVLGHVERRETVVVGQLGRGRRRDPAIVGEQNKPVVHIQN